MKFLASMAALITLGGCNAVVTSTPMFTHADEAGAPEVRPGLWRFDNGDKCDFDESLPLKSWPECAGGVMLRDGNAGYFQRGVGKPVWTIQPVILTAGSPRIGQAQVKISGDVTVENQPYAYAGVRPTGFDGKGRVTAFAFWPVQCGSPPPGGNDAVTTRPLPGLTLKPGEPVCTTSSPTALRNAAKASEAWAPKPMSGRWVRDHQVVSATGQAPAM